MNLETKYLFETINFWGILGNSLPSLDLKLFHIKVILL